MTLQLIILLCVAVGYVAGWFVGRFFLAREVQPFLDAASGQPEETLRKQRQAERTVREFQGKVNA